MPGGPQARRHPRLALPALCSRPGGAHPQRRLSQEASLRPEQRPGPPAGRGWAAPRLYILGSVGLGARGWPGSRVDPPGSCVGRDVGRDLCWRAERGPPPPPPRRRPSPGLTWAPRPAGFEERGRALAGARARSCLWGRDPQPPGRVTSRRPAESTPPAAARSPAAWRRGAACAPALRPGPRRPLGLAPAPSPRPRRSRGGCGVPDRGAGCGRRGRAGGRGARRAGRPRSPIPGPTGGGGAAAAALRKPCPVAGHHGNGTAEFRGRRAARPDPRPASARPPAGRAAEEPREPRAAPVPARRPRPAPRAPRRPRLEAARASGDAPPLPSPAGPRSAPGALRLRDLHSRPGGCHCPSES